MSAQEQHHELLQAIRRHSSEAESDIRLSQLKASARQQLQLQQVIRCNSIHHDWQSGVDAYSSGAAYSESK
jgi:hypothetical protein